MAGVTDVDKAREVDSYRDAGHRENVPAVTDARQRKAETLIWRMVMQTLPVSTRIAIKNILFLTDFSEPSVIALPFAAMIARAYGAKVTALHALVSSIYTYMTPEMAASLLDAEADVAKTEMSRVEAGLMGLPRETMIERNIGIWPVSRKCWKKAISIMIVMGRLAHGAGEGGVRFERRRGVPARKCFGFDDRSSVRTGGHNGGRFHASCLRPTSTGLEYRGGVCRIARGRNTSPG